MAVGVLSLLHEKCRALHHSFATHLFDMITEVLSISHDFKCYVSLANLKTLFLFPMLFGDIGKVGYYRDS